MEDIEEDMEDNTAVEINKKNAPPTTQMHTVGPMDAVHIPAEVFNPLMMATTQTLISNILKEATHTSVFVSIHNTPDWLVSQIS